MPCDCQVRVSENIYIFFLGHENTCWGIFFFVFQLKVGEVNIINWLIGI